MNAMAEPEPRAQARVLIADDEPDQRNGLSSLVSSWGFDVRTASDGVDAMEQLKDFDAHVMLSDLNMPRMDGFVLLQKLKTEGRLPATIVLTAFGSIDNAIRTVHDLGAYWFLEKPIQADALKVLLARAVEKGRLNEQTARLQHRLRLQGRLEDLVGESAAMQQVFSTISQIAPSSAAVLITGESGTGKELVARAIHNLSKRNAGPFVAVNCAALPESLVESELFGHEKGAFTGALQKRAGCFELADGGTLLLDEIGDMPIGTQAKLLRVLEDSKVRRLGGSQELKVDTRLIASTNKDIQTVVSNGEMREDLFYRLNVFHIEMPPLREHLDDIEAIAAALIESHNKRHECRVIGLDSDVLEQLRGYQWPGNVRELRNVLERAVIVAGEGTIAPIHIAGSFDGAPKIPDLGGDSDAIRIRVGTSVHDAEKSLIFKTLEFAGNNKTRAAKILEISLKTLHNKLKEYAGSET